MSPHSKRGALVIILAAIFCILPVPGKAATHASTGLQHPSPSSPAAPVAIPVAEVATRATEVSKLLQALGSQVLVPSPEVNEIGRQLPEFSDRIVLEYAATAHILGGPSTLETLQTQQQLWERLQLQTNGWLSLLTVRATRLQEALDRLDGLQKTWSKTRDASVAASAPAQILRAAQATLTEIQALQPALQAQNAVVLDLQSRVAQEVARCGKVLSSIAQAQQREMGDILTRDGLPLWNAGLWNTSLATLLDGIYRSASFFMANIRQYFHPPSRELWVQVGLFAALAMLFSAARRQVAQWSEAGEEKSPYISVFDHPYASALLVPLLFGSAPAWQAPTMVRHMFTVLSLVPIVRLTRQGAHSNSIRGTYALGILFTVDAARQVFAGAPLLDQGLLVLEALSGMVLVGWSLAYGHLQHLGEQGYGTLRLQRLRAFGWLVLLSLSCGLAGGVFGYLRFARLLLSGLLAGFVLALVLYCVLRVLSGLVAFSLRVRPLRRLRMVQQHRGFLENRTHRVLMLAAIGTWGYRSLDYTGLLDPAQSLAGVILTATLRRGSLSISLGDILAFVITVWASYLLSGFIRFVLQEDVYPRTRIASGLSYAVSSLLHYLILTVGFVMGLAALGMDLSKLTILAGAFGVGIGIGLQSVVNNFASGLILLFERPIHVGDTIEVGDLLGKVRQIGIRASKVRTRQGADIIVPNAQLVTERVTNWTLADQLRRIELPVGVNYGAAPQKVIEVLENVARTNPNVLNNPAPRALLKAYGDSSINFELRAWTDQFDEWSKVRSDLAVALYTALQDAGMQFPFPQREVRLLKDDTPDSDGKATATESHANADGPAEGEVARKNESW